MAVLIDTSILIDYQKNKKEAIDCLNVIVAQNMYFYTSQICAMELLRGNKTNREFKNTMQFLNFFIIFPVSASISQKAYNLFCQYHQSHNLDIPDSLIAATAIIHEMKLLTINQKHFKMIKGLKIEKPY